MVGWSFVIPKIDVVVVGVVLAVAGLVAVNRAMLSQKWSTWV